MGSSDCAGVRDTSGGAGFALTVVKEFGRSTELRDDRLDCVCMVIEGRLGSLLAAPLTLPLPLTDAATADDRGAERVFFIREKIDVTRA